MKLGFSLFRITHKRWEGLAFHALPASWLAGTFVSFHRRSVIIVCMVYSGVSYRVHSCAPVGYPIHRCKYFDGVCSQAWSTGCGSFVKLDAETFVKKNIKSCSFELNTVMLVLPIRTCSDICSLTFWCNLSHQTCNQELKFSFFVSLISCLMSKFVYENVTFQMPFS